MSKKIVVFEPKISEPAVPAEWDYEKSVAKIKGLFFKWKEMTIELVEELLIARAALGSQGRRTDLGTKVPKLTWGSYCEAIGSSKRVVNRWLARYLMAREFKKIPPPKNISQVIYADPPWDYSNAGFDQSAKKKYPTIPTVELCNPETWLKLPVSKIVEERSVLFLWVTYPFAKEGFQVCEAWGFKYKAQMVWVKNTSPGLGWFVTPKHELLYIATRGQELHPAVKPDSVFFFETRGHSRKPEEVYKIIESMYTGPYIELFARAKREGWESWGNEI